jgi:hypothetical protein
MLRILLTTVFSLVAHLLLGWAWTLGAGILGGALADRGGWLVGAIGVGLGWAILTVYNFVVAAAPSRILVNTLGQLFGNIPPALVVGATVLIGVVIGGLGGTIGQLLSSVTGTSTESSQPAVS